MPKKRTAAPFYTKSMQRVTAAARASGDLNLILLTTNEVQRAWRARAVRHLQRYHWPKRRPGTRYYANDPNLNLMHLLAR